MIGSNFSLRMKLSYFINTENESAVINKINEIYDVYPFKLQLWYDEGEVTPLDLKGFLERYEKILHYKTTITANNTYKINEFTWFNIVHKKDIITEFPFRFQYWFTGPSNFDGLMDGLTEFKDCVSFVTAPKPPKPSQQQKRKQKRNDYED